MPVKKRSSGEGSIRHKTISRNGKNYSYWEARLTVGKDPGTNRQIQKTFTGKTQKEVRAKMQAAAVAVNEKDYFDPIKITVSQWIDIWLKDSRKDRSTIQPCA